MRLRYELKLICLQAILSFAGASLFAAQPFSDLTAEDYCDIKVNSPKGIKDMTPMPDGETYLCEGTPGKTIDSYSYKTGKKTGTIFDVATVKGDVKISEFDGFELSSNGKYILLWNDSQGIYRYSFRARHFVFDIMRGTMKEVSKGGLQRGAVLSHDGSRVAFQRDNNIYLANLDYGTEIQVTKTGKLNSFINGTPDWAYEEEFGILNTMRFAPDDSSLAFLTFDESQVPVYHFDIYSGYCNPAEEYSKYPGEFEYKYPLAGDNNSVVTANVFNLDTRITKKMDLPMQSSDYIPSMEWGGSADRLMIMVLNRNQNELKLYNVNPGSTVAKLVLTETSSAWLSPSAYQMVDYGEQDFVIGSDRTGWRHLYLYDYAGNLKRTLTSGDWYVTAYYGRNAAGEHFLQCTKEGSINRNVACVSAKGFRLLHPGAGWESASFSRNFAYYVRNFSDAATPPQYTLWSQKGKIADLELNEEYAARYAQAPRKEFLTVPNAEGKPMDAYIIKPADFDASRKYPLIMQQYNGPESQEVRNRWSVDGMSYLCSQGYLIACVDGRGTGFRGREWSDAVYMQLGRYETLDQLSGARYFAALPYVDPERLACFGWSYGGYMSLLELTASDTPFAAGVAMAPVTDWRFYDSIYTERFMRTPQQNHDGYEVASTLDKTSRLNVPLLIMSGTSDDNVHFYNTLKYTSKLTSEGKIFDMMAWTGFDHSLRMCNARTQLYRKVLDFYNTRLSR